MHIVACVPLVRPAKPAWWVQVALPTLARTCPCRRGHWRRIWGGNGDDERSLRRIVSKIVVQDVGIIGCHRTVSIACHRLMVVEDVRDIQAKSSTAPST